jgi:hypothetical protein
LGFDSILGFIGEVMLVEDTTGKGHLSTAINDQLCHAIFVLLE